MKLSTSFLTPFLGLGLLPVYSASFVPPPPSLNLTAISAKNGVSILECWALSSGFVSSTQAGTVGALNLFLGQVANASYTVLPPGFDGGLHRAPAGQYVAFLSGLALVTLPNAKGQARIEGGENGLIIAADTADISTNGHNTTYPGNTDTIALQIPFADGKAPAHTVLHEGPCECNEMAGI